jgi:hypothetical protein
MAVQARGPVGGEHAVLQQGNVFMRQTSTLDWCFELQSVRSMGRGNKPAMEANLVHYNRSECNRPIGFMGDADGNPRQYRCPHRTTGRGAGTHTPRHSATNPVARLDVLRQLGLEADGFAADTLQQVVTPS